ncbi:hypothetical protein [Sphingomonas sp. MA1305]|uniref:hypothetical protein n=1 Tax=Sphingomonas sp. MA1305 TaxID=2479204 RepID=UPI0018DFAF23|nr:hypothetical protein [Sphingomonas sp. MA1305]
MLRLTNLLALAALPLIACLSAASALPQSAPLRSGDAGRKIEVKVGEPVRFALPTDLSTGCNWQVRSIPAFTVTSPATVRRDSGKGQRDATFLTGQFRQSGKFTVEIANVPMGYGGGNAVTTLKYHFVVLQAS